MLHGADDHRDRRVIDRGDRDLHLASDHADPAAGGRHRRIRAANGIDILRVNLRDARTKAGCAGAVLRFLGGACSASPGFESSANFVEEQAEGVFPKTLRNMWIAVTFFNPGDGLAGAGARSPRLTSAQHEEALLAHMGGNLADSWLHWLISIDAALVLSGAVLTSFVGVNGLVRRMTLDRCLPQFLLKTNRRGTTHRIIIGFFLLTRFGPADHAGGAEGPGRCLHDFFPGGDGRCSASATSC